MKSILLASASVIGLAGAAAAEVTFGGDATFGYNNDDTTGDHSGFYWSGNVAVTMSQTLDNGLTVSATFDWDIDNHGWGIIEGGDNHTATGGYVLALTSDNAGLYFGDTDMSADMHWSGVSGMEADSFDEDRVGDAVLRGEYTFGDITASVSYNVYEEGDMDAMQFAVVGSLGGASFGLAYQDADGDPGDEIFGISVGTTLGGADLSLAYADNSNGESSIGLGVSYPVGPVTLGMTYAMNEVADDAWEITVGYADGPITVDVAFDSTEDWSLEGSYDVGNGIMVYAGLADAGDDIYVGGTYDLGGGASLLISYADDGNLDSGSADDEIGAQEYQNGMTVEVSFEF